MSFANDLAILLLQKEVALNDKISLIQLPHESAGCPSGKRPFVISGWGVDQPKNPNVPFGQAPSSRFLQAVRQECLSIDECIRKDYDQALVWCVGDSTNSQNAGCKGDSGGKC